MKRRGEVAREAYRLTHALAVACPTCSAPVGEFCTRSDGSGAEHVRRIPCHSRMQPVDAEVTSILNVTAAIDFTEPRHPQEI